MKPTIREENFQESIEKAISKGRHVDDLTDVLKKYKDYQNVFENSFAAKNSKNAIYLFHVVYLRKENVWREIEISGSHYFKALAKTIIKSMMWDNDHMHGFALPVSSGKPDHFFTSPYAFYGPEWEDDPYPTYKSNDIRIADLDYQKYSKLNFIFDFGDDHEFIIEYKGNRERVKKDKNITFPQVIDQRGVAPEQYPVFDGNF